MPFQAYLDDSGTHDDSPICVAAGYFGGLHYWKQFSLDWDRVVKQRGVSEFHATRFWSRAPDGKTVGDYENWTEQDCEIFLEELLAIVQRYRIWPTGSAVVASDWNALTPDERCFLTGGIYQDGQHRRGGAPRKVYFAAFLFAVQNVAAYCDQGHTVDFVVDESRALNGYAQEYFQRIKASRFPHASKLGTIRPGDSKNHPGLQAADLLAYLTFRRTRESPNINLEVESDSPLGRAIGKARDVRRDFKLLGEVAFDRLLLDFRHDAGR